MAAAVATKATSALATTSLSITFTGSRLISSLVPTMSSVIIASSIAAMNTTSRIASHEDPPADNGECRLLGPFAVLVQTALGALALLSLVFKRWRERPQRPVKIWAFDVSKQVFGTLLLHLANVFMSMFSAGEIQAQIAKAAAKSVGAGDGRDDWKPNPCSFYLLNLGIDTTLGIVFLILILKVLTAGASRTPLANPPESIKSGYYGDPPRVSWWLKQSWIYFTGLLLMKVCVFFIFELCPWIVLVGDWALRWTEGNEALQIAFVMLIFPLIMNAFQYYVIDTFIKNKPVEEDAAEDVDEDTTSDEQGGLLAENVDGRGRSIDEDEAYKARLRRGSAIPGLRVASYNPETDGETGSGHGASAGSSSSRTISVAPDEEQFKGRSSSRK